MAFGNDIAGYIEYLEENIYSSESETRIIFDGKRKACPPRSQARFRAQKKRGHFVRAFVALCLSVARQPFRVMLIEHLAEP